MQCEKPESRFYQALRIVVRNPGLIVYSSPLPSIPDPRQLAQAGQLQPP
jgi:hypothetical protein